jgi:hypothetical protein
MEKKTPGLYYLTKVVGEPAPTQVTMVNPSVGRFRLLGG